MALLIKNSNRQVADGNVGNSQAYVDQWIHVTCPARVLPQTTTDVIFKVRNGRVLVKLLLMEVTTVFTATDPVLKVSSQKLDAAMAATVGTTVDIASTVSLASLEVGGNAFVEGDGSAIVKANAGATFVGSQAGLWIAPRGQIYVTTGDNNTTGAAKWDLWYIPLESGAYVEGQTSAATKV